MSKPPAPAAPATTGTAYIEHDPVTGDPLLLKTSFGMQALYVYDASRNPIALLTSGAYVALAQKFDPYGTNTVTTDAGGNGPRQNPYGFANGIQDRATGFVKFGHRWYNPTDGRFTQQDTLDAPPSTPPTPTATHTRAPTPSTTPTHR